MIPRVIYEIVFWAMILVGGFVIAINWIIFFKRYILRTINSSWIPLMGGLLVGGAFLLPHRDLKHFFMVPVLLDYGCVLGFLHTALFLLFLFIRKSKRS